MKKINLKIGKNKPSEIDIFVSKLSAKISLIGGVIFSGISLFLPWGEFSILNVSISFFHWGLQWYDTPQGTQLQFMPTNFSGMSGSPGLYGYAAATLLVFFMVPLSLIVLGAGIVAFYKVDKKRSKNALHAAVSAVAAVILFVVFINLSFLSNIGELAKLFSWSLGFYLMIAAAILFVIAYGVLRTSYSEAKTM